MSVTIFSSVAASQLPATLGQKTKANSLSVVTASDELGQTTASASRSVVTASDALGQKTTANSLSVITSSDGLGQKTKANSLSVATASDDSTLALYGALTETAPASDTASSGINGRLQRVAQNVSTLNAKFTATAAADANRLPVDLRDALSIGTFNQSAAATLFTQDCTGYQSITVQVTSAGTTCTITYECSEDNSTWVSISGMSVGGSTAAASSSTVTGVYQYPRRTRYFRARVSTYTSGTVTVVAYLHAVAAPLVTNNLVIQGIAASGATNTGNPVKTGFRAVSAMPAALTTGQLSEGVGTLDFRPVYRPHCIPEVQWSYVAAASGLVSTTTAVTVKAAAAAGLRNYITALQIYCDTGGTATEFAIRDGAAGTVIWRIKIPTTGMAFTAFTFEVPLFGTAATLLEIVTLTSSAGAVYCNLQGYFAP